MLVIELVGISLIVGLWHPVLLPGTGPWLHTKMSRLPMGPMAETGLERRQVGVPGRLVSGMTIIPLILILTLA